MVIALLVGAFAIFGIGMAGSTINPATLRCPMENGIPPLCLVASIILVMLAFVKLVSGMLHQLLAAF